MAGVKRIRIHDIRHSSVSLLINMGFTAVAIGNRVGHENPTISFRVSDYERRAIEADIKMSGMLKKDYFVRSCIYNRVCVVGKKETIYPLVEELRKMQEQMVALGEQFQTEGEVAMPKGEFADMQTDYLHLLRAVIRMLDSTKYLWEGESKKEQE